MVFKSDKQRKKVMAILTGSSPRAEVRPIIIKTKIRERAIQSLITLSKANQQKTDSFIEKLNSTALVPITNKPFAKKLILERMTDKKFNDPVFDNLSKDKSSGKLFVKPVSDPTLPIVFIDINFASNRKGNPLSETNTRIIKKKIKSGKKLDDIPFYSLKDGKIGEGNHRVQALKELGFKTVPVRILSGWD